MSGGAGTRQDRPIGELRELEQLAHYAASLDCVHCGLCIEECPTYDVLGLETDNPRGRIYMMRAFAEGRVEDPETIRPHLDRCLDCRACESVCPSGVRYGQILETVRAEIEKQAPRRGLRDRLRGFLLRQVVARQGRLRAAFGAGRLAERLGLRRLAEILRLLPDDARLLLPRVPPAAQRRPLRGVHEPAGPPRGRVGLLTGCVMEQMFGDVNRATRDLLVANGFTVVVPEAQRCCGALLVHDARPDAAVELARANAAAFADVDAVVLNSAGCGAAMREYSHLCSDTAVMNLAAKVVDVCEFLAREGMATTPAPFEGRVAYDDACHLCHAQGVRSAPRELLARVPGLELVDHAEPEACCGSAGIYNLVHPGIAREIGRKKADALLAAEPDLVVTGNPGCLLQIQGHLRGRGSDLRVAHTVEMLLPVEARR